MNAPLVDTQRRTVRDLRISVTDRCNLRCVYCMLLRAAVAAKDDLLTTRNRAIAALCLTLGVTGIA